MSYIDAFQLRDQVAAELERRRRSEVPGDFREVRDGEASLYASTGAANIHKILGLPLGPAVQRRRWAEGILQYQRIDGSFSSPPRGHALCMALQGLHILGHLPPPSLAPLAPTEEASLRTWLNELDWSSTHKELWGRAAPLLAAGAVSHSWREELAAAVASRISPDEPLRTWCEPDAPPWRVVSCIYHVLSTFDAGAVPYPHADLLLNRLFGLQWPDRRQHEKATECTDGDWAWLLVHLCMLRPERTGRALQEVREVCAQRAREFADGRFPFGSISLHAIYCHLWVTACLQRIVRDHVRGFSLHDTLNDPSLLRVR